MKLTVLQENITGKINLASRFVATRAQIPVLSNLLLKAKEGRLQISGTNLETGITASVAAKIDKEGEITVPARILTEVIANLPPGKLIFEEKESRLKISNQTFSIEIAGIQASEFPPVPTKLEKISFSLKRNVINLLAKQVTFAAAKDDTRPVLTGININLSEKLIGVATDGFRMSYKEIDQEPKKEKKESKQVLLPARVIEDLDKAISNETEKVDVSLTDKNGQLIFGGEDIVITSRTLEGQFPDFNRVIPKSWATKVTVGKEDFLRSIKAASVFSRESASIVKLKTQEKELIITSESNQYGKEEILIDAKVEGEQAEVAFNYRFILDFLNSTNSQSVSLETLSPTSPGVFQDTQDQSYKHIIMPVRIQQ